MFEFNQIGLHNPYVHLHVQWMIYYCCEVVYTYNNYSQTTIKDKLLIHWMSIFSKTISLVHEVQNSKNITNVKVQGQVRKSRAIYIN